MTEIDVSSIIGADLPVPSTSWGPDQVILYHLALGAGRAPTDPHELSYVYERDLKVLPSFATLPAVPSLLRVLELPGLDIDEEQVVHGGHELSLPRALPQAGTVHTTGHVAEVFSNRRGVVIVVEATSRGADGVVTCLNRSSIFLRGCVAPGAPSAPASVDRAPDRPPDYEIEQSTFPQQPLLYRLCGDKSPLHVDPEVARRAGFERPILHGLCTYGIACKAVVDHVLDGDVSAIENYRVRFAGVVFPGETIVVRCWCEKDVLAIRASVKEGGRDVLTHASIELNDDALSRARP